MSTIIKYNNLRFSFPTKVIAQEAQRRADASRTLVDAFDVMTEMGVCLGESIIYAVGVINGKVIRLIGCTSIDGARDVQYPVNVQKFIVTPDGKWYVPAGTKVVLHAASTQR
jgi:hypothetical protein